MSVDIDTDFIDAVEEIKTGEAALLISKHQDYGPTNIANAPGGPLNGLAVRIHDKAARLGHLLAAGADPQHESLIDTFKDLANYGTIGQMVLAGYWPGVGEADLQEVIDDLSEDVMRLELKVALAEQENAALRDEVFPRLIIADSGAITVDSAGEATDDRAVASTSVQPLRDYLVGRDLFRPNGFEGQGLPQDGFR